MQTVTQSTVAPSTSSPASGLANIGNALLASGATIPATAETSKPVTAKPAKQAKTKTAKTGKTGTASKAVSVAKPVTETPDKLASRRAERAIAADFVADYYAGASLPFKSASDTFSPLNRNMQKQATKRQAALICAMLLADTSDNIKPDGTFKRGGFTVKAKLNDHGKLVLSRAADATEMHLQPESGCLGDMLGRVCSFVSGPTSGAGQRDSIFKLNLPLASREISELIGGKIAGAAIKRLAALQAANGKPAPATA